MNKYESGKIYKIIGNETGKIYIGSTTEKYLSNRFAKHKNHLKQWKNGTQRYCYSFELLDYEECDIVLLETCKCNSKDELHARERFYIDNNECVNKQKPNQTPKQWVDINIEHLKEYRKKYFQDNKVKVICECGGHHYKHTTSRHLKTQKHLDFIAKNLN